MILEINHNPNEDYEVLTNSWTQNRISLISSDHVKI